MTEEEAKTKWCPMVRAYFSDDATGSVALNTERPHFQAQCIASACMMWRVEVITYPSSTGIRSERSGYCGLAGKP